MTRFNIDVTVICPSDWDVTKCRAWIERLLSSDREKDSLIVTQLDDPGEPA